MLQAARVSEHIRKGSFSLSLWKQVMAIYYRAAAAAALHPEANHSSSYASECFTGLPLLCTFVSFHTLNESFILPSMPSGYFLLMQKMRKLRKSEEEEEEMASKQSRRNKRPLEKRNEGKSPLKI